ncbi:MAG TPA: AMP-binding protein [Candidatus Sulfopaludibacter sp.]|jgi:long-chain acyl-CoA synthetase|nr:AMP-binding protein [Candidatus Sulfopaludibacter sp.]
MRKFSDNDLPLQWMYRWETERAGDIFLTQPFDGGKIREWTWAETANEVRRMAAYLKAQKWEPGSRVAILSRNCAWWIMADLAIWMAGHVTVPIYPSLKSQTIRQILEHSDAKACFLGATDDPEVIATALPAGLMTVALPTDLAGIYPTWDDLITGRAPLSGQPTRPPGELATIIYTSGTTGMPKGVKHCFAAFAYDAMSLCRLLDLSAKERVLSYLPLAHIVERAGLECTSLFLGSRIFFSEGLDTFLADLSRARPTIFITVPRLLLKFQQGVFAKMPKEKLERLLRIPILNRSVKRRILRKLGLATVRHAACGAAPLSPEIHMWYRNVGLDLAEGYGMTETLITHLPGIGRVRPGYVGRAMDGVETKLGEKSELLIRSPMNLLGYHKNSEATADSFTPEGFFRTGDVAQIDEDGQLRIIGRIKEQFKTSKGKYVAPAPIESQLTAHPDVEACCIMGEGMPSPFALVVLSDDARKRCSELAQRAAVEASLKRQMDLMNGELDPHERVKFVAVVEGPWTIANGIMTPTLKIKRSVVEGRYQSFVENWYVQQRSVIWEET